jgi:D-beta-D-heptose 7-phosphate kinase / D-beta-D-heptose 1-phosphate adenosyltransferase
MERKMRVEGEGQAERKMRVTLAGDSRIRRRELNSVAKLIALDREKPKKIAVIGDSMIDVFVHGTIGSCQDDCQKLTEHLRTYLPGGAANAARQLSHWNSKAHYIGLGCWPSSLGVNCLFDLDAGCLPQKERHTVGNKIVFRHDREFPQYALPDQRMEEIRKMILDSIERIGYDGILVCDYDKGMLTYKMMQDLALFCQTKGIPLLVDAKQRPGFYGSVLLQVNDAWEEKFGKRADKRIITRGCASPVLRIKEGKDDVYLGENPVSVHCVNHVGAGDCFAAHTILGLAHGLNVWEAAEVAHSAGRVYVQHLHNRPPWPHEIQRDSDPVRGKTLCLEDLPNLRESTFDRIVFTNGVFRLPHAGHCWLMAWAKEQGAVLVVGINDDCSAWRQKPGEPMLPLSERMTILSSLAAVDYIIPYSEDEPCRIMEALKPDFLVKGADYKGQEDRIAGSSLVREVRIAPDGPFPRHCRDVIEDMIK